MFAVFFVECLAIIDLIDKVHRKFKNTEENGKKAEKNHIKNEDGKVIQGEQGS